MEAPPKDADGWKQLFMTFRALLITYQEFDKEKNFSDTIAALDNVLGFFDPIVVGQRFLKRVVESLPTMAPDVAAAKERFAKLSEREQRQALYLQRFVLTDDAFGIMVRGHVLIESALQRCIYAYVSSPRDLYDKMEMFFQRKLQLARMLDLIDDGELQILSDFNELRNRLAHLTGSIGDQAPAFHFTSGHEKWLWRKFIANPSMSSGWPEYDDSQFPLYLRYVVMHLYLLLNNRADRLKTKKLQPVIAELGLSELEKMALPVTTMMLTKLLEKLPLYSE